MMAVSLPRSWISLSWILEVEYVSWISGLLKQREREAAANGWHGVAHTRLASGLEYEISDDVQSGLFSLGWQKWCCQWRIHRQAVGVVMVMLVQDRAIADTELLGFVPCHNISTLIPTYALGKSIPHASGKCTTVSGPSAAQVKPLSLR